MAGVQKRQQENKQIQGKGKDIQNQDDLHSTFNFLLKYFFQSTK